MALSNNKDYYRMRYGQAGFDPTEMEPQSIFDALAMDFGTESRTTTVKEDKKGIVETEVVDVGGGVKEESKRTLTWKDYFGETWDENLGLEENAEVKIINDSLNQDLLKSNPSELYPGGHSNADNTMTLPDVGWGEKSPDGKAELNAAGWQELIKNGLNGLYNWSGVLPQEFSAKGLVDKSVQNWDRANEIFDEHIFNFDDLPKHFPFNDFNEAESGSFTENTLAEGPHIGEEAPAEGISQEDIKVITSSPTGQAMAEELQADIDAADGDENILSGVVKDFNAGLDALMGYDPQLAKSLFAAMGAMLMGQSFGDAIATGFGVMEEAAMLEEAADKAAAQEVIAMLVENAPYLNDEVLMTLLKEYDLGVEESQRIWDMWEISKLAGEGKKAQQAFVDLTKRWGDLDKYVTADNSLHMRPAIANLMGYVMPKNKARGTSILKDAEWGAINDTIGLWGKQVEDLIDEGWSRENAVNEVGPMEAIWEGMHGSYRYDEKGKVEKSVGIPNKEMEKLNLLAIETLRTKQLTGLDEKDIPEYIAKKHREFMKTVAGKGPYGKQDKDGNYPKYIKWLYEQVLDDFT